MEKTIKISVFDFIINILLAIFFIFIALDPLQEKNVRFVMVILAGCQILSIVEIIKDFCLMKKRAKKSESLDNEEVYKLSNLIDNVIFRQNDILDSHVEKISEMILNNELFDAKEEFIKYLVSMVDYYAAELKEFETQAELEENLIETEF